MGDDVGSGERVNGTAAPAEGARPQPTRAERDAAERAAFLAADVEADLAETAEEKPAAAAPKKKPAPVEDDDDDELEASDDEDLEDDDAELDLVDDDEDDEEIEAPAPDEDPDTQKRLASVRRAEQRVRAQAEARDRDFEQKQHAFVEQWKPKIEAAEKFEKIPKNDIAAILKAKGHNEDDYEDLARMLWGMSKAASADPKNREAVMRMQRERELREQVAESKAATKALEEKLATRDAEQAQKAAAEKYLSRITKSFDDETPRARKRLEAAPASTKRALAKLALELSDKSGGAAVDAKKVARVFERRLGKAVERAKLLDGDAPAGKPAAKPTGAIVKPAAKPAIKVIDRSDEAPAPKKNGVLPTREEMIAGLKQLDREVEPD